MNPTNIVSIYPSDQRAKIARRSFLTNMLRSLAYLQLCYNKAVDPEDRINIDLSAAFAGKEKRHHLAPELFFTHDSLLIAIRQQAPELAKSILLNLSEWLDQFCEEPSSKQPEIKSLGNSDWEQFVCAETRQLLLADLGEDCEMHALSDESIQEQRQYIYDALNLVSDLFPNMQSEIHVFLNKIKVFGGKRAMGITDVRMFGCMFIRQPRDTIDPKLYYCEHIVHEVSHMYLNAAMSLDPLVLNPREAKYKSPIRPDPRPMLGVYHATFVTSRIVQMFDLLAEHNPTEDVLVHLQQQNNELKSGIREVQLHGDLTSSGSSIIQEASDVSERVEDRAYWSKFNKAKKRKHRFGSRDYYDVETSAGLGA